MKKNYELIIRLYTAIYWFKLLRENGSDHLWVHNEFNMVSERVIVLAHSSPRLEFKRRIEVSC